MTENIKEDHKKRRNRRYESDKVVFGTSTQESGGLAAEKRVWLYVGRCRSDLTEDRMRAFLQGKKPGYNFEITKLTTRGVNASFKIGVSNQLKEDVYDPSFWPANILIKRFRFFRGRSNID